MGSDTACALVTAAGNSTRMAGGIKKEYRLIDSVPILRRICFIFHETGLFSNIFVTCPPGDGETVRGILGKDLRDSVSIVNGGGSRQESVFAGLTAMAACNPVWVLIHDGSRPWISSELITRVLDTTRREGACIPAVPSVDTLVTLDSRDNVAAYPDRELVLRVQTPQGFSFKDIYTSHRVASSDGRVYNDDSEIYRTYCKEVRVIPGDPENRKITYPRDM